MPQAVRHYILLALFSLVSANPAFSGPDSPWPMFHHDPRHTGLSEHVGSKTGALSWCFKTRDEVNSSPAIARDGTVYFGSLDGNVYAVGRDGKLKWSYAIDDKVYSSPALGSDGSIYVCSWSGKVVSLDPQGNLRWKQQMRGRITSSPAISRATGAKGDVFYVGSDDYRLYAITGAG
ncbi:MAG: PQQ-like beta-propeller repeat protein, partial [Planctomycetes bacterium]|nr:PQQ-like beta-propeller repeat protein [Planctomycetota bacterium]